MINREEKKVMNIFQNILKIAMSNLTTLFSGVLVGFLLPKIIGITDYGYYKTFTLYTTYIGLFHLGIEDGIYLAFGEKNYEELDKKKFRFYTFFLIMMEFFIAIAMIIISFIILKDDLKFIFICLSIYLLSNNLTNYYKLISQITLKFKELSVRTVLNSILLSIAVIGLGIGKYYFNCIVGYKIFLIVYVSINVLLTLWYIYTYKDITFGERSAFKNEYKAIIMFLKNGFPLMIANLCSTLILTIDRQFVNIVFDMNTYAIYAFAYNLLALVTTVTSAISTVIYPMLKRSNKENLEKNYNNINTIILFFIFGCLTIFFPLKNFILWFLPKYSDSIQIFRIIFPGLAITSSITIVMHNYYKTLNENFSYFIKSIIILIVSIIFNFIAYRIFYTTKSISIASIISMLIWYLMIEKKICIKLNVSTKRNYIYMLFMMLIFYIVTSVTNNILGACMYAIIYLIFSFIIYKNMILNFLKYKINKE